MTLFLEDDLERDPNGLSYILGIGDQVEVIGGPFTGCVGTIQSIKRKITVKITQTVFSVPPKFQSKTIAFDGRDLIPLEY
jgi:transcription antitermination factor NusG